VPAVTTRYVHRSPHLIFLQSRPKQEVLTSIKVRAAHTHSDRLAGAIGQGAGTHHFFSREWLEKAQNKEYPWNALPALTEKFGYKDHDDFMDNAQDTWSLVKTGVVNMKSCRLLLINGMIDGLMPIEDSMLLSEFGSPKEMRLISNRLHMGMS
jgi:hypothetical protein